MLENRERDGVYITEECVNIVEVTTSRALDKAKYDIQKLEEAFDIYSGKHPGLPVHCWLVTRQDPTAEQLDAVRKSKRRITSLSIVDFESRLINVREYLNLRSNYFFGSISDPSGRKQEGQIRYIDLPILDDREEEWNKERIANSIIAGERFTLLGDFGIGKSMTLREIHRHISNRYLNRHIATFTVYLNLRDHYGQRDPAEILLRHGQSVGYPNPSHLVRAWRAGYVHLLLDGFDEIGSYGLSGTWHNIHHSRRETMIGIRNLIAQTPQKSGIAVAGRTSFFDSEGERNNAIGDKEFRCLLLNEFNESQIRQYLDAISYSEDIPSWIPARPLLLATVFSIGLSHQGSNAWSLPANPADGWAFLVSAICAREAKIESGLTGDVIQRILEHLASIARTKPTGVGPLTPAEIRDSYQDVSGFPPPQEALLVLQRLPGLAIDPKSNGEARNFVDEDFIDACAAGAVWRALNEDLPREKITAAARTQKSLGEVGHGILCQKLGAQSFDKKKYAALQHLLQRNGLPHGIAVDLFRYGMAHNFGSSVRMTFTETDIPQIDLEQTDEDLSNITFSNCVIRELRVAALWCGSKLPLFDNCLIENLDGFLSEKDLPKDRFLSSCIENYLQHVDSNASIRHSELPCKLRVLIILLRKLFIQSIGGRHESALRRGMDHEESNVLEDVICAVKRHGFARDAQTRQGRIWIPTRRLRRRASTIIHSPVSNNDPLVAECLQG